MRDAGVAPSWIGHHFARRLPLPSKAARRSGRCACALAPFGDGLPRRDLWLSPDHAVFVDDVLIPIKRLINSTSIEQVPMDQITYYHVELEHHDVLLAEGLPAESYLDTGRPLQTSRTAAGRSRCTRNSPRAAWTPHLCGKPLPAHH